MGVWRDGVGGVKRRGGALLGGAQRRGGGAEGGCRATSACAPGRVQQRGVGGDAEVLGAGRAGAPGVLEPDGAAAGRARGRGGAQGVRGVQGPRAGDGAAAVRTQVRVRRVPFAAHSGSPRHPEVPGVPRPVRGLGARLRHLSLSAKCVRTVLISTLLV